MSMALDFGASAIRSLRRNGSRLTARSSRLIYAVLPDSPAHRQLLERGQVCFLQCESNLVLVGDAAHDNASLFRTACRPLLTNGRVPENDPLARQVIVRLTESVLPTAQERDEVCAVTLPGDAAVDGSDTRADFEFLTRVIRLQGYDPLVIPSGQALVLAELVGSAFTGIGLTFGHASCEATLAHRGAPVCHASIGLGGEWIDQQLLEKHRPAGIGGATHTSIVSSEPGEAEHLTRQHVTRQRESLSAPVHPAADDRETRLVARLLTESLDTLLRDFAAELKRSPRALDIPQPLAIVCAGGLARTPGFGTLLVQSLQKRPLPVEVSAPRLVTECAETIARGLLIAAELETSTRSDSAAA